MNTFKLGASARITDPCYSKDVWCCGTIATKPGTWKYDVVQKDADTWGESVWEIIAWHAEHPRPSRESQWNRAPIDVGVDSGQCGIFDDAAYPEEGAMDDAFYEAVCEVTLSRHHGVVNNGLGVACISGFGDGSYDAYWIPDGTPEQQAVAIKIVFITDEEDSY